MVAWGSGAGIGWGETAAAERSDTSGGDCGPRTVAGARAPPIPGWAVVVMVVVVVGGGPTPPGRRMAWRRCRAGVSGRRGGRAGPRARVYGRELERVVTGGMVVAVVVAVGVCGGPRGGGSGVRGCVT